MRRLFWLVNDFLYWLTRGRVDLDVCLTVRDALVERLREDVDHLDAALAFTMVGLLLFGVMLFTVGR